MDDEEIEYNFTPRPRHADKDPTTPEYSEALHRAWAELDACSAGARRAKMVLHVRCGGDDGRCRDEVAFVVTTASGLLWCSAVELDQVDHPGRYRRERKVPPVGHQFVLLGVDRSPRIRLTVRCPHHQERTLDESAVTRQARVGAAARHAQAITAMQ